MTHYPPETSDPIGENLPRGVVFGYGTDPARYVVDKDRIRKPRFFIIGGDEFVFPVGTEGFRISGQPTNAEHRYLDDNALVVRTMHRDARRIMLSGVFPGATGTANMGDLLELIAAVNPPDFKRLSLPGVFVAEQQVVVEDYDFNHDEQNRTGDVVYQVTFLRVGIGRKLKKPKTTSPPDNPTVSKRAKKTGKPSRVFTVREGARTLRAIASLKYKDPNKWRSVYNLNTKALNNLDIPLHKLPTSALPLGMKLRY